MKRITLRRKTGKSKNRTKCRKTNTRKQKKRRLYMKGGYNFAEFERVINDSVTPAFINEYIPAKFVSEGGDEYDDQYTYVYNAIKHVVYKIHNSELQTQILNKIKESLPSKNRDTVDILVRDFKTEKKRKHDENKKTQKESRRTDRKKEEEERKRLQQEEEERKRLQQEEEIKRLQQEEEIKRQHREELEMRMQEKLELKRRQKESEIKRQRREESEMKMQETKMQEEIKRRLREESEMMMQEMKMQGEMKRQRQEELGMRAQEELELKRQKESKFWIPFFNNDEQELIRFRDNMMWLLDNNKICSIIDEDIPTYATMPSNIYEGYETSQYNSNLCLIFIILGILSEKLKDEDISIIFKGGKAVQLVLSKISYAPKYMSDDIDVLLLPKRGTDYNREKFKELASNIGNLIQWIVPALSIQISPHQNPDIVKLSLEKENINFGRYKAMADIDFKELPPQIKPYFENTIKFPITVARWGLDLLFECPTIDAMIDEKTYYLIKYNRILDVSTQQNDTVKIYDSNFHLLKIYKALKALIEGLVISNPTLSSRKLLENKIIAMLNKMGYGYPESKIESLVYQVFPPTMHIPVHTLNKPPPVTPRIFR